MISSLLIFLASMSAETSGPPSAIREIPPNEWASMWGKECGSIEHKIEGWQARIEMRRLFFKPLRWWVSICTRPSDEDGEPPQCRFVADGHPKKPVAIRFDPPATLTVYDRYRGPPEDSGLRKRDATTILVRTRNFKELPAARDAGAGSDPDLLVLDESRCVNFPPPIVAVPPR